MVPKKIKEKIAMSYFFSIFPLEYKDLQTEFISGKGPRDFILEEPLALSNPPTHSWNKPSERPYLVMFLQLRM